MGGAKGFLGISPLTPFGRIGILSMDDSLGRPLEGLLVISLLAGLGGSSSSSLLKVRSTTGPDDRLLLAGIGAAADENDCSLEEIGGVLIMPGS